MCNLLGEEGGTNATSREMKIQHEKRGGVGAFQLLFAANALLIILFYSLTPKPKSKSYTMLYYPLEAPMMPPSYTSSDL